MLSEKYNHSIIKHTVEAVGSNDSDNDFGLNGTAASEGSGWSR
jgi:hypothetical protein